MHRTWLRRAMLHEIGMGERKGTLRSWLSYERRKATRILVLKVRIRDQASRIEKIDANDSASNVQVNGLDTDAEESTISNISNNNSTETIDENSQQNQNANETTLDTDFHTAQRLQPQLPEETSPTIEVNYSASENASVEVPGCLPKYKA